MFLNSFDKVVKKPNSNFIGCMYPVLNVDSEEENDKHIFVYVFCDKTLSMLNYIMDFADKNETSSIFQKAKKIYLI